MTLLPEGFALDLDRSVRTFRQGAVLAGGHPGRLVRLTPAGVHALAGLVAGEAVSESARQLGGRLVEAGMAHPRWVGDAAHPRWVGDGAHPRWVGRITMVVPVRDRVDALGRCLASLGTAVPVVVVDDGSVDPASVRSMCAAHGATLIARPVSGGPAAARNDALAVVDTELVGFVDSDCAVTEGWLDPLVQHFDDPTIGAVAPRIRPLHACKNGGRAVLDRYSQARSALDMGAEPSEVGPDRMVRYLPTAALLVRRSAVAEGFDPDLRVGEDVDLVWRLLAGGWRIRYEPGSTVHHREPATWAALLARRFRYGTSAGPLASRHRGRLAPVELRPWPTVAVAGILIGSPATAAAALVASAAQLASTLSGKGIPLGRSLLWSVEGVGRTWVGVGRAATMLAGPLLIASLFRSRRSAVVTTLLVVAPPAADWWRTRPALDPWRWSVASLVDDAAYGAGVWTGCISAKTFGPVIPQMRWPRRVPALS